MTKLKKNDLSECKVGDMIWSVFYGWEKVTSINCSEDYPILVNGTMFTIDGKADISDVAPVAFTKPPEWFNKLKKK